MFLKKNNIQIFNQIGKNSLKKNINLALNAKINITVDSGFNHLIRLTDAKILSFWGPTNPSIQCLDLDNNEKIYYKNVKCSPCVHKSKALVCGGFPKNFCMNNFEINK